MLKYLGGWGRQLTHLWETGTFFFLCIHAKRKVLQGKWLCYNRKTPRVLSRFRNSSTLLSLLKMSVTFASDCSGLQVFSWRSEVTEPQTEGREIWESRSEWKWRLGGRWSWTGVIHFSWRQTSKTTVGKGPAEYIRMSENSVSFSCSVLANLL